MTTKVTNKNRFVISPHAHNSCCFVVVFWSCDEMVSWKPICGCGILYSAIRANQREAIVWRSTLLELKYYVNSHVFVMKRDGSETKCKLTFTQIPLRSQLLTDLFNKKPIFGGSLWKETAASDVYPNRTSCTTISTAGSSGKRYWTVVKITQTTLCNYYFRFIHHYKIWLCHLTYLKSTNHCDIKASQSLQIDT